MRWIRWLLLATGLGFAAAAAACVGSALLSLDRDRQHTARTNALPLVSESRRDGLVRISARGHLFRARIAGLANPGPDLILLHGFPETSAMWIPLIEAAASAGFRVVAFDQRGYSPGARPEALSAYVVPELIGDVLAVADALGFERFHLVGHDWGAVVGWGLVAKHPDRVRSWTALSIPHPGVILAEMRDAPPAYIRFFGLPYLPELALSFNGHAFMRDRLYAQMPPALRDEYLAVFSEPGALTAALNWYRAMAISLKASGGASQRIERPVLFIRGQRDWPFDATTRERQGELIEAPYRVMEPDSGHWLMQEQTRAVVEAILAHVQAKPAGALR